MCRQGRSRAFFWYQANKSERKSNVKLHVQVGESALLVGALYVDLYHNQLISTQLIANVYPP